MKKYTKYLVVIGLCVVFGAILNVDNIHAADNNYIKNARVNWKRTECAGGYDSNGRCTRWGESYFTVSFDYGSDCGSSCVIESKYFTCCGNASQSEWSNSATGISVKEGVESGGYQYYDVVLYNNRGNYQPVCGKIKKKKDLPKGRLVITGKNIYDDYNIMSGGKNLGHQEIEAIGLVYSHYTNLWNNRTDKYKFIGWKLKNQNSRGLGNIIEDTNAGHSPHVGNKSTTRYANSNKYVYQRLYYNLASGEAKDIYAYYAPACNITIDSGEGTTVNAYRSESPYSGKGSLPSGFDIYLDDEIDVTFGLKEGYKWVSRSINSNTIGTDSTKYTVGHQIGNNRRTCENVKIVARAEPIDDDGDTESINTGVSIDIKKNGESEFSKEVRYVKPEDTLYYRAQYRPDTQKVAEEKPNSIRINSGELIANEDNLSAKELFNSNSNSEWSNYFDILSSDAMSSLNFEGNRCNGFGHGYRCLYSVGDSNNKEEINSYVVRRNDVGEILREEAVINLNFERNNNSGSVIEEEVTENTNIGESEEAGDGGAGNVEAYGIEEEVNEDAAIENDIAVNPSSIKKKVKDGNVSYDISTGLVGDDVQAVVPYNFKNSVEMSNDNTNDYAFAGETFSTSYNITTAPRYNGLVGGDAYATIVKGAKWKAGVCTDKNNIDTCSWYEEKEGDLNTSNKLEGSSEGRSTSVITPDLPAGAEIYVRAAVYPAESSDDNWQDPGGNHGWAYSNPVTIKVAKKPSFQVWGGDIYVGGQVSVPIANKSKLDSCNDETLCNGKVWVFGSWGELAVVSKDPGNLASGAVLGYTENNNGEPIANPGGGDKNELKDSLGNLTFRGGVGELSSESIENLAKMLEDRVTKVNPNDAVENTGTIGGLDNVGESKLYKNESEINITGNILYKDGPYNTLESIPKVIIYANNININCDVERIDAILIAKGNINTCPDRDDKNAERSAENSNKLRINGAVIAGGTLKLNRTYGAATGNDSMKSAEIINMDPSWYLWIADIIPEITNETDEPTNDILVPTYMRELPPRY